jgi:hypothetical protein
LDFPFFLWAKRNIIVSIAAQILRLDFHLSYKNFVGIWLLFRTLLLVFLEEAHP